MTVNVDQLKKLRKQTQAGVADCRQALEDTKGDYDKARKLLENRGLEKASKKSGKTTTQGLIESYIHANGKIGVLVELKSETDFVARNEEFRKLAHEIAMQIAAMDPKGIAELMASAYIRDASITIEQLVKSLIAKVGENVTISRFSRLAMGD
ncbi:translation elongation factor Ts [Candidatus Gottesmanbacteria bacterium RBG_16_52_11]|uniref:Elongation factor Ts n=1 Tax=Candidatus Gottesmanbacteria bacterium RBG_16_52_11 TaxID=1798374 RepID=A0A1F5YNZ6_9BACT|nr:MAG: translation elongation factor Ts [Candidatus Gottesmanbacteria bacterium RBG_16_52_11]